MLGTHTHTHLASIGNTRKEQNTQQHLSFLAPNPFFPKRWGTGRFRQLFKAETARALFVSTHSSWRGGRINATVFELPTNVLGTSNLPLPPSQHSTVHRLLQLQRGFAAGIGQGTREWERNRRQWGKTTVKKRERFLESNFEQKGKITQRAQRIKGHYEDFPTRMSSPSFVVWSVLGVFVYYP